MGPQPPSVPTHLSFPLVVTSLNTFLRVPFSLLAGSVSQRGMKQLGLPGALCMFLGDTGDVFTFFPWVSTLTGASYLPCVLWQELMGGDCVHCGLGRDLFNFPVNVEDFVAPRAQLLSFSHSCRLVCKLR